MSEIGKRRRLSALKSANGLYVLAALDHNLTFATTEGLESYSTLSMLAETPGLTGIVLNAGIARHIPAAAAPALIVQTFGLPNWATDPAAKVRVGTAREAVTLGAVAIAVELNLRSATLAETIRLASKSIRSATTLGLPSLVMATGPKMPNAEASLTAAIRVATELGADLIKVGIDFGLIGTTMDMTTRKRLEEVIRSAPPVVMAGGSPQEPFFEKLAYAYSVGFQGICVGRNLFGSTAPAEFIARACRTLEGLA